MQQPATTIGCAAGPPAVIPGAVMPYWQAKAEVRAAIIGYLKELH